MDLEEKDKLEHLRELRSELTTKALGLVTALAIVITGFAITAHATSPSGKTPVLAEVKAPAGSTFTGIAHIVIAAAPASAHPDLGWWLAWFCPTGAALFAALVALAVLFSMRRGEANRPWDDGYWEAPAEKMAAALKRKACALDIAVVAIFCAALFTGFYAACWRFL